MGVPIRKIEITGKQINIRLEHLVSCTKISIMTILAFKAGVFVPYAHEGDTVVKQICASKVTLGVFDSAIEYMLRKKKARQ